jgi:hypothetical protein
LLLWVVWEVEEVEVVEKWKKKWRRIDYADARIWGRYVDDRPRPLDIPVPVALHHAR